jgi:hypothetical protein
LFFGEDYKIPPIPTAPHLEKKSPWNLLTNGNVLSREQHLISGLPQTMLRKNVGLPDSVFNWMLDSICVQPSLVIRQEYSNMVASCPEQVGRLLTVKRLQQLFVRLGAKATDYSQPGPELAVSRLDGEPYEGRDWSCVQSFISLLGVIATQLSVAAVQYATQALVHMSLDKFLLGNIEVLAEFEYTIQQLATAITSSSWDNFVSKPQPLHTLAETHLTRHSASRLVPY